MTEGWFNGEVSGAGGGGGSPTLHGRAAGATTATSLTITLDHATLATDTIVVCGYTNAGSPGAVVFSGLGATWTSSNQSQFIYGIGTSPSAGQTNITVTYPFVETFVLLAASYGGLAALSHVFTSGAGGVSDVDVGAGLPFTPSAGQISVIGWAIYAGATAGATTSFTDTNGTYTTVAAEVAGAIIVEMAAAAIPATGATDHVGHRPDTTTHSGGVFIFGPSTPAVFEGWA